MSGVMSNMADQIETLVCDAVPDPPRLSKSCAFDKENLIKNKINETNKKQPSEPVNNEDESTTGDSTRQENKEHRQKQDKHSKTEDQTSKTVVYYNIINNKGLHIGNKMTTIFNIKHPKDQNCASTSKKCNSDKKGIEKMTPEIEKLSKSQLEITKDDMLVVKTHISTGWKELAQGLEFSEGQIMKYVNQCKDKDFGKIVYKILLDWKSWQTKDATVGKLICAMWSAQEYECAKKFLEDHTKRYKN